MKKIILVAMTLAAAACSPMRHPATTTPENVSKNPPPAQAEQPAQQAAQPQAPAATN